MRLPNERVRDHCTARGVACEVADVFGQGGSGALALAAEVVKSAQLPSSEMPFTYAATDSVEEKIFKIATQVYGAEEVDFSEHAQQKLETFRSNGLDQLPICMAKTQESLSENPKLLGRPSNFRISVRDFEMANGAGFLIALTGSLVRMPALPRVPAAERIQMDNFGNITGW